MIISENIQNFRIFTVTLSETIQSSRMPILDRFFLKFRGEKFVQNFCNISAILQAATSATIAAVAAGHIENQNSLLAEGAVK